MIFPKSQNDEAHPTRSFKERAVLTANPSYSLLGALMQYQSVHHKSLRGLSLLRIRLQAGSLDGKD